MLVWRVLFQVNFVFMSSVSAVILGSNKNFNITKINEVASVEFKSLACIWKQSYFHNLPHAIKSTNMAALRM
jgi:hypothetical protein